MQIIAPLNSEVKPVAQSIEVYSSLQIPGLHIIGLPSPEISEARERVRAAIEESGLEFPRKRVVVNLSPASLKKRGTGADLSIALAILAHSHEDEIPAACRGEVVSQPAIAMARLDNVSRICRNVDMGFRS